MGSYLPLLHKNEDRFLFSVCRLQFNELELFNTEARVHFELLRVKRVHGEKPLNFFTKGLAEATIREREPSFQLRYS
jgi:hypothetical protein